MELVFEKASLNDADELAAFSRKSFDETFSQHNTLENMEKVLTIFSPDIIASEIQDPDNVFFLIRNRGQIVGYTKLSTAVTPPELKRMRSLEICRIYVDQVSIGSGLGKALMQQAIDYAELHAFAVIWLGVWEHNPRAIAFYKKWGFEHFGEHVFMLGDDPQTDWLMKKTL